MVVDHLQNMELREFAPEVGRQLCQVFLQPRRPAATLRLLRSRVLLTLADGDARTARAVADALCSSQLLETSFIDLLLEMLSAVNGTAEACGGLGALSSAALTDLCGVLSRPAAGFDLLGR